MPDGLLLLLSDGLIILGLLIMTIAVYGIYRMPDIYMSLHAASKALFLGIIPLLLSLMLSGDSTLVFRSILIALFLVLTTPISAHAIGRSAYIKREPMQAPDNLDESGRLNVDGD